MPNRHLTDTVLVQKCFLVREDGKILTVKGSLSDEIWPGAWEFPGGGYEYGEDTSDSLRREVMEETNLTLNSFYPVYMTNVTDPDSWLAQADTTLVICYASRDWTGDFKLSAEHIDFLWESPQELLKHDFAGDAGFFHASLHSYLKLRGDSSQVIQ